MRLIALTEPDGKKVYINFDDVSFIREARDYEIQGTVILVVGASIIVKETMDEVIRLFPLV